MIKQSRIKYDKNGKLADVRTQSGIELYQRWQAGNRQRNTELLEYNKMRAYYEAKKIDPPYATIGAFRRARRAQSENYQESRKEWGYKPKESRNAAEQQTTTQENTENPLTNTENSGIVQEQSGNTYEIAKGGGKHYGKYQNFKDKCNIKQLEKSIRSFTKRIIEHQDKLRHPEKYCKDWENMDDREKEGLLRKWKKDLRRNEEELEIAKGVLEEKKNGIK